MIAYSVFREKGEELRKRREAACVEKKRGGGGNADKLAKHDLRGNFIGEIEASPQRSRLFREGSTKKARKLVSGIRLRKGACPGKERGYRGRQRAFEQYRLERGGLFPQPREKAVPQRS